MTRHPPAEPSLAALQRMVANVAGLTAVERRGGLVLDVAIASARASIALKGAHVLSWTPEGHTDVLWCSPLAAFGGTSAIRGGIPLCWPWFGPHATDPKRPQHGYARNAMWDLVDVSDLDDDGGRLVLTFRLPAGAGQAHGLGTQQPTLFVDIGRTLALRLETENSGTETVTLSEALHTYFRVGDVSRVRLDGLDGAAYRDNADGGRAKTHAGPLSITKETVALFDRAPAVANLVDPVLKRCISIMREPDAASTVVWNPDGGATIADIPPGGAAEFLCVESGNIGAAAVSVAPGDTHTCSVVYAVEKV
jgi:D-hexose-6-phosphate mutarotase